MFRLTRTALFFSFVTFLVILRIMTVTNTTKTMNRNFVEDCLTLSVERRNSDLVLLIESDFAGRCHKSQLYVDDKRLAGQLEELWKSIKTKKLLRMHVGFSEIDYYDNMTDMYEVPSASIERGLKRARIGSSEHGAIPKDWSICLSSRIADTTTVGPIIEVCKKTLGSRLFTPAVEKAFVKKLRPVLQKKTNYANFYNEND